MTAAMLHQIEQLPSAPMARFKPVHHVDGWHVLDTKTGLESRAASPHLTPAVLASIYHEHGLHHIADEALRLELVEQPSAVDEAVARLAAYEAIRDDQRAEDDLARRSSAYDCPQCGEPTDTLREGCCEPCRDENQRALDEHNLAFDRWEAMPDSARAEVIRRAAR